MPFVFSHIEYCDMHFVYGFCNGNALAAVEEYRRHFPDRRIPSSRVFTRIHQTLRDTGCLPSVKVRSEREVIGTIDTQENILHMVQRSPRLSTRRMAFRTRESRMQEWRTLREENFYPYHDQTVQHLEPGDLTPLHYYVWGHMKTLVYESKVDSRIELRAHESLAFKSPP